MTKTKKPKFKGQQKTLLVVEQAFVSLFHTGMAQQKSIEIIKKIIAGYPNKTRRSLVKQLGGQTLLSIDVKTKLAKLARIEKLARK